MEGTNTEITIEDLLTLEGVDVTLETDDNKEPETPVSKEEKKEPEQEIKLPETEEPKEEEKPKVEIPKTSETPAFYSTVSKKLLEDGDWHDVLIEVDGKEVKLSEANEIDEETFFQVYKAQEEAKNEDIEKNYLSVKDVDENKLKLINIIKNGGDLKEIFQSEVNLKRPFEDIDLTNETTQKAIVFQQYKKQGLSESEAQDLTEKAAKEFTLDTKAETIVKAYQSHYDKMLVEKEKEIIEAKQAEEIAVKEYRKTLTTSYKQEGLSESLAKRLVDAATKKDTDGELIIDAMYQKLMEDPQKAKDLIFFILEPENYLKAKGASIKKGEQIDFMKKVTIIRESGKKAGDKTVEDDSKPATDPFSNLILE